jgi:hypothetical protein
LAPRTSPATEDLSVPDEAAADGCAEVLAEEVSDFVSRHVLEQDAEFFDG